MVRDRITVSDYKRIEKAQVEFQPGLTIISGGNSNGKSTLLKALRAMVLNRSNDGHYRRGTKQFWVEWEVYEDEIKKHYAAYGRQAGSAAYKRIDNTIATKVGQQLMQDVVPEFPVKVFKFKNSEYFLPNFVFQGEIPLFSQVDIYELLSTMFGSVAKLLALRDRLAEESKAHDNLFAGAGVSLQSVSSDLGQAETDLRKINVAAVEAEYRELQDYENTNYEYTSLVSKRDRILGELQKTKWYSWSDSLDVKEIERVLERSKAADQLPDLSERKYNISMLEKRLVKLPEDVVPVDDVVAYCTMLQHRGEITKLEGAVRELPSINAEEIKDDYLTLLSINQFKSTLVDVPKLYDGDVFPVEDIVSGIVLSGLEQEIHDRGAGILELVSEVNRLDTAVQEFKGMCPAGQQECPVISMVFGG